jgi:hypothetical protein
MFAFPRIYSLGAVYFACKTGNTTKLKNLGGEVKASPQPVAVG